MNRYCLFFVLFLQSQLIFAQYKSVQGYLKIGKEQFPLEEGLISLQQSDFNTLSDANGFFRLSFDSQQLTKPYILQISHPDAVLKLIDITDFDPANDTLHIILESKEELEEVEVKIDQLRTEVSMTKLDAKGLQNIPSPFQDISSVLATLPGVSSNNEMSNQYSVRGGNYDENLVYVNGIPIHRPFVLRAGQQEGLSFINLDMTESIIFSAGGWNAEYGEALSSVMNIEYKKIKKQEGALNVGLLGGSLYFSSPIKEKSALAVGIRHKDSRYLLRTLEVEGQYFPRFTDVQLHFSHQFTEKTSMDIIGSFSHNDFQVNPESRETDFGAFPSVFRLFVGYAGQERLNYKVWQGGINLQHQFNRYLNTNLIVSTFYTNEREYSEVENAYRLCSLGRNNNDPDNPDPCAINLGAGRNYEYRRNKLSAGTLYAENKYQWNLQNYGEIKFGIGLSYQQVDDELNEYSFVDSTGYVEINHRLFMQNALQAKQFFGYAQHQVSFSEKDQLTYGVRLTYWDYSQQWLVSPRIQYAIRPNWQHDIMFRLATGLFRQPAFYREIRDFDGKLAENLKAQSSVHLIGGADQRFKIWGREFTLVTETWVKYLYDVIPYDIDNVRIRYYANNNAEAYALGFDVRMGGEFIPGSESWFSLGVLNTAERIEDNERDWQRRPSDQRVRLGIFFQDHIPNDPTYRVYLNVQVGTGLPFGPPNNERLRNSFVSPAYRRVDLGLSKELDFTNREWKYLESLWISAEVLNLLGSDNPISFNWVQTVDNSYWAVPNSLSARFFNVRMIAKF